MSISTDLQGVYGNLDIALNYNNEALSEKGVEAADSLYEVGDKIKLIENRREEFECLKEILENGSSTLIIPDSITKITTSMLNKSALQNITIPDSVTFIGDLAFYNCKALQSITIPDSVISIGDNAFNNCTALTSATIGNSVTSIGDNAFYYCSALTSVSIGNSVTSIGVSAFSSCDALTNVTIPDSVTSIDSWAFSDCSALTRATIGNSVTFIGRNAFSGCGLFESLILPRTESIISTDLNSLSGTKIDFGTGYIYVPQALLSQYQSATNWTVYSAQFRVIEDYPDITGG